MAANKQLTFVNLLFVPSAVGIIILHKVRLKRVLLKSPHKLTQFSSLVLLCDSATSTGLEDRLPSSVASAFDACTDP